MSYKAIITPLTNVRPHPNADRIKLATVVGSQVVIGLDRGEGELGIYFPPDGQLTHEMCVYNDLYSKSALTQLGLDPARFGIGFFDVKRRVRAQKFRGEISDGLWLPLDCLKWYDLNPQYNEGDIIEDEKICNRYETQATKNKGGTNQQRSVRRGEALGFPKHYDTEQFAYNYQDIPEGSIIYLTEKLHGTSGRYGLVRENAVVGRVRDWIRRWLRFDSPAVWSYLNGTRNVIVGQTEGEGWYGTNDFRANAVKNVTTRKGEVAFFELVGYVSPGVPIMPSVSVPKEMDDTKKTYGTTINYTYGCQNGECKLFVYRIVQFNEDGQGVDLSWPQVVRRCKEIGINCVPEIGRKTLIQSHGLTLSWLQGYVEELAKGPSTLDPSHIREGVVVRVETPDGRMYCLKHKSFVFKVLEGIVKVDDSYIDMEESS